MMTTLWLLQDMEKHGHLLQCFSELRQMLLTPIKPYTPAEPNLKKTKTNKLKISEGVSGDEEEDIVGCPTSPASSPQAQHSSSDGGSDLEELLAKDFPQEDLPSLITRAMGKGKEWVW